MQLGDKEKVGEKIDDLHRIGWTGLVQNFGYKEITSLKDLDLLRFLDIQVQRYSHHKKNLSVTQCRMTSALIQSISNYAQEKDLPKLLKENSTTKEE